MRPRQSKTAHRDLQVAVHPTIRAWSAASHDPARSSLPSSTRGNLAHGKKENLQGTANAPAPSAHRSGGRCRRCRSISLPFYPSGWRFEWRKGVALPSTSFQKTASLFRPGLRPEARFSSNENSIPARSLAGSLVYCSLFPAAIVPSSVDSSSNQPASFRYYAGARLSHDANIFCLASPKRSRHSTGE